MSYSCAADLQGAIFQLLQADPDLASAGVPVHDALPPGAPRGTYVLLGPEDVIDRSDASGPGAEHRFTISVVSDAAGFSTAKRIAGRVSVLLQDPPLDLGPSRLVHMWFHQAQARRIDGGRGRQVELRFRARIEG
ncbi:DUF3168 domain-containing protein [Pararhodobacter sp. SW119]|uniref:DUF3168 domain-containing protein n=1 Tax=Pararhodobacter sp. SW119 TaxID=2780075 RepID=UPI001AE06F42|nr:DUF3168 domain-containing protein [Pararhodobacter sp. SW119]